MKTKIIALLLLLSLTVLNAQAKISAGYYYASSAEYPASKINFNAVTHIIHAFIKPKSDAGLTTDSWFWNPALITEAHANNVPVLVAVGGWGNSEAFPGIMADETKRALFADNLVSFCLQHGYDGVDIDWEYPKATDKNNFTLFVKDLREKLTANDLDYLTMALPSSDWNGGYDIPALKDHTDWFGIMTYDFYGPWESNAGHNSPLFPNPNQSLSTKTSIDYYINKGMPANKLCIGIPFYGYNFGAEGLYKPQTNTTSISYKNVIPLLGSWNYLWDNSSKVPYLINNSADRVISFEDTNSVKVKTAYLYSRDIAGVITWRLGYDMVNGQNVLLNMLEKYLVHPPVNLPGKPELTYPENKAVNVGNETELLWSGPDSNNYYKFQLALDETFSTGTLSYTYYPFNKSGLVKLNPDTKYFWRVKGVNNAGEGEWSEVYSFTTEPASNIENGNQILPEEYSVGVYPNPFNPSANIAFTLKEAGDTEIRIYNVLGREIARLDKGYLPKGEHRFNLNLSEYSGVTSGIYFLRLNSGSARLTAKLVYLK